MNNDGSKQLPPQGDGRENEVGSLLAAASDFARSVLESVQTLAGTAAGRLTAVTTAEGRPRDHRTVVKEK